MPFSHVLLLFFACFCFCAVALAARKRDKLKKMLGLQKKEEEAKPEVSPLSDKTPKRVKQPKSKKEQEKLKEKYAEIDCLEERAFQILVDLNMVEKRED